MTRESESINAAIDRAWARVLRGLAESQRPRVHAPAPVTPYHPPSRIDIRLARRAAGLTVARAAALACVTRRTWTRWESGDTAPSRGHWLLWQTRAAVLLQARGE